MSVPAALGPRRRASVLATVLLLALTLLLPDSARAGGPVGQEATYKILRANCVLGDNGYVAVGSVKTWVNSVRREKSTYYQKVTVEIDKLGLGGNWRSMEKRTYSWSKFTKKDLPTYSTSAVRTAVGATIASGGTLSFKWQVKLKRVITGPDLTTWSYEKRSASFSCDNGGDF